MNYSDNLSLDTLERTYAGLIDDVIVRYSDRYLSQEFFNKMIAKNIFFGGGLYINDGYLVNHPIARRLLLDENSLLRVMLSTGFIKILTRARDVEGLQQMAQRMAEQKNESFEQLVKTEEWKKFKPEFDRIVEDAFEKDHVKRWPDRDLSVGYTELMKRAFAVDFNNFALKLVNQDDWRRIQDEFFAQEPHKSGSRDKLEKAAKKVLGEDPRHLNEIMTIGNQAYHYNFGLALTGEAEERVAVDTLIGPAFGDLLESREVIHGELDNIPLLRIPPDIQFDQGSLFISFLRSDTKAGAAKLEYIKSLRKIIEPNSGNYNELKRELQDKTKEYRTRILELLCPQFSNSLLFSDDGGMINLIIGKFGSVSGVSARDAGLAIQIQDFAQKYTHQYLVERFTPPKSGPYSEDEVITLGEIRPQIASLAFNKEEAKSFLENIPPAPKF